MGDRNPKDFIFALLVAYVLRTVASFLLRLHRFWAKARHLFSSTSQGLNFASVQNLYLFRVFWHKASQTVPGMKCLLQMPCAVTWSMTASPQEGLECDD